VGGGGGGAVVETKQRWQAWAAAGQTQSKKKKKKKEKTSFSIGRVRLHLAAGWVPVDLAEVVVAAAETAAGVGGSGSDWRASGMGVQAVSCSQKKRRRRKREKKREEKTEKRAHQMLIDRCHSITCRQGRDQARASARSLGIARGRAALIRYAMTVMRGSGHEKKTTGHAAVVVLRVPE
jgi:hypothetical protein